IENFFLDRRMDRQFSADLRHQGALLVVSVVFVLELRKLLEEFLYLPMISNQRCNSVLASRACRRMAFGNCHMCLLSLNCGLKKARQRWPPTMRAPRLANLGCRSRTEVLETS